MFKIGILSDPHKRADLQKDAIDKLKSKGAQYLLHAGDFCIEENLRQIHESGLPYAAVFGNNDRSLHGLANHYNIKNEPWYFKIRDLTIKMMHMPYYLTPDTELVIYGHTHHFAAETKNNTLYLNPGEICAREKPKSECVLLTVNNDSWEVEHLFRNPEQNLWQNEKLLLSRIMQ